MAKNYMSKEYLCVVCKGTFIATEESMSFFNLEHSSGEELSLDIIQCPNCESMLIPEGMNQIAWLMPKQEGLNYG